MSKISGWAEPLTRASRFHETIDADPSLLSALAILVFMLTARAAGPSPSGPPSGVTASSWIPITHGLGAVIEQALPDRVPGGRVLPSALGYFAIRRGGRWLRLSPNPQGALYRGPLRPPATSTSLPISENLRFIVEQQAPERDAESGELPSVLGYFVGKRDGHWLRLGSSA